MILLAKDNTVTPDAYSSGDGIDPVSVAFSLNGTGIPATMTVSPADPLFVWADDNTGNIGNYSGVGVEIVGEDPEIDWELSVDGVSGWASSLALPDLDVSVTHQATQIYARATVANDGSVETANYVSAKITITATENPA